MSEKSTRKWIAVILLAFVFFATASSVINPLFEATDELRHYRFVQHIIQRRALPVQGEVGCSAQGHHPPLFYATAAAVTFWVDTGHDVCTTLEDNPFWAYRAWEVGRDNKNQYLHTAAEAFPWSGEALAAHLTRLVNVAFGTAVVYLTFLVGMAIWPKRPFLALGATAFVAFNPMFVYMSGSVNNDVIAGLAGAAVTLAVVRLVRDEHGLSRRWGVVLGILYGLALLSKFNLLAIAATIETAVTYTAWRKKQWRLWLETNLLIAGFTVLLAGWWFVRNQLLYGEPTGVKRLTELWGARDPRESWGAAIFELPYLWTSLWGRFGYGQVPMPDGIYMALCWIVGLGLAGCVLPFVRRNRAELAQIWPSLGLLLLNCILFFAVIFNYLLISPAGPMGRFFFPALPSLAILTFYGWSRWLAWVNGLRAGEGEAKGLAALALAGMAGLTAAAIFGYLAFAFSRPKSFAVDTAVPNPVNARFDTFVTLHGYQLSPTTVEPGGYIDISLYWDVLGTPPGNYLLFVHLIDQETGTIIAQRDTHPGLGNFPSSQWQAGDRFIEEVRLYLPETAYTPANAELRVGFYAPGPNGYRLGITGTDGQGLGDSLALGTVSVVPWQGETAVTGVPNPLDQNFNNEVRLVGYQYNNRILSPGDVLTIDTYWQPLPSLTRDYRLQFWVWDENGNVSARWEGEPAAGPMTTWETDEVVVVETAVSLPDDLPPGTYTIHLALIEPVTGRPQNIVAEDGHWVDNRLLLAKIRINTTLQE